ncbi:MULTISPECIES: LysR family transcriptional regulator [Methylobacterium]|uniref:Transcriptional regulator, LysR family n=2 Tax=Methylobacterium TaxID=407 RepID=B1LX92_METRJ|nr:MULTISPECIES: LysR family transcriptional regulator [Methylobacterium]MBY0250524.1 LysR family transcriptional regulator [Methylobacterium organophilum]ACB27213.1 transcriptional regulator, LysR family [Methylobacterium radiotolerans JCM 2831]MDE4912263.1 LysR family transcriptional regulator [Methylobacterium sp. 092160098-2]MDH3031720.1 LysR family transcriptional regulator [Methylobacterium fujisawaense]MDQ0447044.1 DNA-binding transcriptional LysR family regulator [Methylobacterium aero
MTLDQLRIFVAVAERQHVTRAAEALNLVQSAVSTAIANIEGRHATKLFHRVGRGIELTEAGRVFLVEARAVLARAEAAELVLADLSGMRRGTLALYASQTIASDWLPRHLVAFRRTYPEIALRLAVGNTTDAADAVRAGQAELGFVEGALDDPTLASTTIARDQLVLVVAPNHHFAGATALAPEDLAGADWVLREAGSGTRSAFEAALTEAGLAPAQLRVTLELPSNEAVRAAVEAGGGATVLSETVVAAAIRAGTLVRAAFELPSRPFRVLRHKERYRSRAADALLELIATSDPG